MEPFYAASSAVQNVEVSHVDTRGPFYLHGLTLIPAWISYYIQYNVWDEITYSLLNYNGTTVEVWNG